MPNSKLIPQAISLICAALFWANAAAAENASTAADDSSLPLLAIAGTALLLVAVLVWRALASRGTKKPDPAAFMTLEQITRLESPEGASTLMKTVQPKPMGSRAQAKSDGAKRPPSPSDAYMSELEKQYPRIVDKLVLMWPSEGSEGYLQSLTIDERGDREGFSRDIAAEIMMLYGVKVKGHEGGHWH